MTDQDYAERIQQLRAALALSRLVSRSLYTDLRADGHGNAVTRHANECYQRIIDAVGEADALTIILPPAK